MSDRKVRFKLCPDLADGMRWTVVNTTEEVLEAVKVWCDATLEYPGNETSNIRINTIRMSDEEFDAMPEI